VGLSAVRWLVRSTAARWGRSREAMERRHISLDQWRQEQRELYTAASSVACVSLAGSLFILVSMLCLARKSKQQDNTWGLLELLHFQLIFLLSVSDAGYCIIAILQYYFVEGSEDPSADPVRCQFVHICGPFFMLCSIFWTLAIAVTLWGTFVRDWPQDAAWDKRLLIIYAASIGGLAATLTSLQFMYPGGCCWITDTDEILILQYVIFYSWLWLVFVLILIMYCQLLEALAALLPKSAEATPDEAGYCSKLCRGIASIVCLDSEGKGAARFEEMRRVMARMCSYPLILIVCSTAPSIQMVHDTMYRDDPEFGLNMAAVITANMVGLLNAIAYGLNSSFRNDFKRYCCGIRPTCPVATRSVELPSPEQSGEATGSIDVDTSGPSGPQSADAPT